MKLFLLITVFLALTSALPVKHARLSKVRSRGADAGESETITTSENTALDTDALPPASAASQQVAAGAPAPVTVLQVVGPEAKAAVYVLNTTEDSCWTARSMEVDWMMQKVYAPNIKTTEVNGADTVAAVSADVVSGALYHGRKCQINIVDMLQFKLAQNLGTVLLLAYRDPNYPELSIGTTIARDNYPGLFRLFRFATEADLESAAYKRTGIYVYLDADVLNAVGANGVVNPSKCSATPKKNAPFTVVGITENGYKLKANRGAEFGDKGFFYVPTKVNACGIGRVNAAYILTHTMETKKTNLAL